mgnify:CR=1 FL=1
MWVLMLIALHKIMRATPVLTPPLLCPTTPTPQVLTNLLWALATLGYRPDAGWLSAFRARLVAQADQLSSPLLLRVTWAFGMFGWRSPSGMPDELWERGRGVLDTPRASLQRMRWAERAASTQQEAAAAAEAEAMGEAAAIGTAAQRRRD